MQITQSCVKNSSNFMIDPESIFMKITTSDEQLENTVENGHGMKRIAL